MQGFATKAIHAGLDSKECMGALRIPVFENAAYGFDDVESMQLAFENKKQAHVYSRLSNPTTWDLELKIKSVTGALGVVAVSSGMAAITNVLMTLGYCGANVVTTRSLFSHTLSVLSDTLGRWGLEVRFADFTSVEGFEALLDQNTCAVLFETISNPHLEVIDVKSVVRVASQKSVPVVVDGTCTTPYLFNSREAGAAIEILSSTKYISGGGTSLGGLIIDNGCFDWSRHSLLGRDAKKTGKFTFFSRLRTEIYRNTGAVLSPHSAYLHSLGLETLALRVDKSNENARVIADFLNRHEKVISVSYPGLPQSPWHDIARKQFCKGYGGIVGFELETKEICFRFMNSLSVIRRATNINDNKTLIIHPASTIFSGFNEQQLKLMKVPQNLIRISLGIEDTDDLLSDITKGFTAL